MYNVFISGEDGSTAELTQGVQMESENALVAKIQSITNNNQNYLFIITTNRIRKKQIQIYIIIYKNKLKKNYIKKK